MTATAAKSAAETIAARATAPGPAPIAVVRVSGPLAFDCATAIAGQGIEPRRAELRRLRAADGKTIDQALVLYFPAPHSFTGEDVVEFQCHGADAVVDWLLETLYGQGVRPAAPGEFSLRAFLNDKLDLTQAEAVADLIASQSRSAAQAALRSLTGEFAAAVEHVQADLTALRVLCEAWLDFPDEDIDRAQMGALEARARTIAAAILRLEQAAGAGAVLTNGLTIALAGAPNAGKSSLLNRLVAADAAIVSEQPGTTRDAVERRAVIAGIPVELIDTAGLRDSSDAIEQAGIERARAAAARADLVLWVADIRDAAAAPEAAVSNLPAASRYLLLLNKTDLVDARLRAQLVDRCRASLSLPGPTVDRSPDPPRAYCRESTGSGADGQGAGIAPAEPVGLVALSALTGEGLDALGSAIAGFAGVDARTEGTFSARRRHLAALVEARARVEAAVPLLEGGLDLAAEELRQAQHALAEVTGEVSSDELLGAIFSTFCIGK